MSVTVENQEEFFFVFCILKSVLRIRIHRIHVFLGLLDPDP